MYLIYYFFYQLLLFSCVLFFCQLSRFFGPEATQEMLDEWRPYQCPFDTAMIDVFELYSLFLPTTGPVERHDRMYRSAFQEVFCFDVFLVMISQLAFQGSS